MHLNYYMSFGIEWLSLNSIPAVRKKASFKRKFIIPSLSRKENNF